MSSMFGPALRSLFVVLLSLAGCQVRAQFSENATTQGYLQGGNTDFLDLYQQSSSLQTKPEIVTIFDSSASMNSLMFHPLYINNDLQDADDSRNMYFTLTAGSTSTSTIPTTNQYVITAVGNSNGCTSTATYTVTVTSTLQGAPFTVVGTTNVPGTGCTGGTTGVNTTPPTITITAKATESSAATTLVFTPNVGSGTGVTSGNTYGNNPSYTLTSATNNGTKAGSTGIPGSFTMQTYPITSGSPASNAQTISITSTAATTFAYSGGAYPVLNLQVFMLHNFTEDENETPDGQITWSTSNGSLAAQTMNYTVSPAIPLSYSESTANFTFPTFTYSAGTAQPNTPTTLHTITSSPASGNSGFVQGATLSLSTYFTQMATSTGTVTWSIASTGPISCGPGTLSSATGTGYSSITPSTVTWTIPTYCVSTATSTTTITPYYVTVNLDPRVGSLYTASGVTYLTAMLTNYTYPKAAGPATPAQLALSALIKPDGTPVGTYYNATTGGYTYDADLAITGPDASPTAPALAYTHLGHTDIRNWIRMASHVRFTATVSGHVRTIDIPIPWNLPQQTLTNITTPFTNSTSSYTAFTNPLADQTMVDSETVSAVVNGSTITTPYGSGYSIPFDQTYQLENQAGAVFSGGSGNVANGIALTASATATAYLNGVVYRPAYISWLFTGTYGNVAGLLNGQSSSAGGSLNYSTDSNLLASGHNFIVYDAANSGLVYAQGKTSSGTATVTTNLNWGQAFGPAGTTWGTIPVPAVPDPGSGKQTGVDIPIVANTPDASSYTIPALTRYQAVKKAAITTWINNQASVYWAFRELDTSSTEANAGGASSFNNSSATSLNASNPTTTHVNGSDSGWTVLNNTSTQGNTSTNGNSVTGMKRIVNLFANLDTPLTYAMARTLAQYSDPNNPFSAVEGANTSQCQQSYLLLFTDGIDNNGSGTNNPNVQTPYITYSGTGSSAYPVSLNAPAGNLGILGNTGLIDRLGGDWNLFTFAGMAAHLADPTLTPFMAVPRTSLSAGFMGNYPTGTAVPDQFLPYAIPSRGTVSFNKDHLVTTMTVGVSLGGSYNNPASPKASLFYGAVVGNPATTTGTFTPPGTTPPTPNTNFHGFVPPSGTFGTASWVPNDWATKLQDPGDYPTVGQAATGAVYFFDGSNPTALSTAMQYAFQIAISNSGNNSTSNPNLPFVGASLGNEVYFGSFYPPKIGGVIWPGDLMMFSTRDTNGVISYLDKNGTPTTVLDNTTAQWDAAAVLGATAWNTRNLYTRYAATASSPGEPMISKFTYQGSTFTGGTDPIFSNVDPGALLATQQSVIQYAAGGDITTGNPPTANRTNIMGDIINSVPASVGYNYSQVKSSLPSGLNGSGSSFNLVLVGTNQGWLHAFGEVPNTILDPNGDGKTMTTGAIRELWAFMPTDFLNDLEYITYTSNTHRHMVDGTPTIYHLDLPTSTSGQGNGLVDSNERAVAIVSLGKGGRSYYALDIHNPFTPAVLWSLVPDEWSYFPSSRIVAGGPSMATVQGILKNFGFSTCTPAIGRIQFNGILHDCVFLGGGFSVPEIDANFTAQAPHGLGRSVMALDVMTGQVLAAVDLTASSIGGSTIGPVGQGVIPFEFILNSGMAQRAYFMDYTGGLWSWGSKNVSSVTGYTNFRVDSSELVNSTTGGPWSIRKVFQDDNTGASGNSNHTNNRYTTLPAPFLVSNFPGPALTGQNVPAAVGIAMISGDRNNPLDRSYNSTTNLIPNQHQLTVVFDRQDSRALGLDTANGPDTGIVPSGTSLLSKLDEIAQASTPSTPCSDPVFQLFTPGCTNFYLGTSASMKYGYYALLPASNGTFVPKGITSPLVDANTLFYSFFTPTTSDPCTGGTGFSYSNTIGNVMSPIYDDARPGITSPSTGFLTGSMATWTGVSSNYFAVGTTSVLQGGTVPNTSGVAGAPSTVLALQSSQTQNTSQYPKVRVWRNVPN